MLYKQVMDCNGLIIHKSSDRLLQKIFLVSISQAEKDLRGEY